MNSFNEMLLDEKANENSSLQIPFYSFLVPLFNKKN